MVKLLNSKIEINNKPIIYTHIKRHYTIIQVNIKTFSQKKVKLGYTHKPLETSFNCNKFIHAHGLEQTFILSSIEQSNKKTKIVYIKDINT